MILLLATTISAMNPMMPCPEFPAAKRYLEQGTFFRKTCVISQLQFYLSQPRDEKTVESLFHQRYFREDHCEKWRENDWCWPDCRQDYRWKSRSRWLLSVLGWRWRWAWSWGMDCAFNRRLLCDTTKRCNRSFFNDSKLLQPLENLKFYFSLCRKMVAPGTFTNVCTFKIQIINVCQRPCDKND